MLNPIGYALTLLQPNSGTLDGSSFPNYTPMTEERSQKMFATRSTAVPIRLTTYSHAVSTYSMDSIIGVFNLFPVVTATLQLTSNTICPVL
jgi:hypothetical protein